MHLEKRYKKDCSFDKKVVYLFVYQAIKYMNNLPQNYKIILKVLQKNCTHIESFKQIKTPKLSNLELAALNFTAEFMSYNTELQLFRVIKGTFLESKIERSVFNKRKRKLFDYIEKIRQCMCEKFENLSNIFIVDSAPVNYLKDVKYNLKNCELIGDRGYISADYQLDLFNHSNIKLTVPMRKNQQNQIDFLPAKRRKRKRIETLISQLDGQFSMNVNFAKTFDGFATRILSKITTITIVQYINFFLYNRNLNNIKINLC